jgi:hypothetical protein
MRVVVDAFEGVTVSDEVEPADWILAQLRPWNRGIRHVATIVPADYPAHGRILHRGGTRSEDLRWADIATLTGHRVDAETQYREVVGWDPAARPSAPEPWREPDPGSLRPDECAAVADVLGTYTTTPDDCWFSMWEGYGTAWTVLNRLAETAPRVALENRRCVLFRGPVSAATAFRTGPWFQSPTMWWPEDRAWCVASELDVYSTYVAATPSAIRALADHPALEVLECTPDQDIDHGPYPTTE